MKKKMVLALIASVAAVAFSHPTNVNADVIADSEITHTDNNLIGGVSKHLYSVLKDTVSDDELEFSVGYTNTKVNFRAEEDDDSEILDTLKLNTKIEYIDDNNDWFFVRYKGEYGYIKAEYVSDKKTKVANKKQISLPKNHLTRSKGVFYYNGRRESYYNLNMSGVVRIMRNRGFDGVYSIREDGVKTLGGYVMVAADFRTYPRGSFVETSLGTGIVCDTGSFIYTYGSGALDIATAW